MLSLFIIITVLAKQCICDKSVSGDPTPFQDWDYIVYSQRWPITSCTAWTEKNANNSCSLPQNDNSWIVHGIWPSKIGLKGPYFCNSALHFDPQQLKPIMAQLQQYWTNVEENTPPNSFWKHEWGKHGTCASILPQLNSVTNYFQRGLTWNQQYNVASILSTAKIVPNMDGYNVTDIYKAVQTAVGKNPKIECIIDSHSKQSLISEVRLCFDKNLDLIDCNVNNNTEDSLGNCDIKKDITYLPAVPVMFVETYVSSSIDYEFLLYKLYRGIKFLIWFTL